MEACSISSLLRSPLEAAQAMYSSMHRSLQTLATLPAHIALSRGLCHPVVSPWVAICGRSAVCQSLLRASDVLLENWHCLFPAVRFGRRRGELCGGGQELPKVHTNQTPACVVSLERQTGTSECPGWFQVGYKEWQEKYLGTVCPGEGQNYAG